MNKNLKNKIKAVIFDIGGVLVGAESYPKKTLNQKSRCSEKNEHGHGVHEYMAFKLKISMDSWFDAIDTSYAKSIEGRINGERAVRIIAKNLKISTKKLKKLWINAYKKIMKKNKELYKIAYLLKGKGFIIGILSDQWHLSEKALVKREDRRNFNPVIVSCDVGMRKPNPKIYRLLIKELNKKARIKPEEIVFIDNRDWNLKPAQDIGIKTILFKNNKQAIRELERYLKILL